MTEADIEIILQAAKEKYPEARPQIISDNVLNASVFSIAGHSESEDRGSRPVCELTVFKYRKASGLHTKKDPAQHNEHKICTGSLHIA